MEADARTVGEAADVYLERIDRLIGQGMEPDEARTIAMTIALCWVDAPPERAQWQTQIDVELERRRAAGVSKKA